MNKDIRVATSFLTHRKRKKLQRALGAEGVLAFLDLLLSVAICRPDGVLSGMDKEDRQKLGVKSLILANQYFDNEMFRLKNRGKSSFDS